MKQGRQAQYVPTPYWKHQTDAQGIANENTSASQTFRILCMLEHSQYVNLLYST